MAQARAGAVLNAAIRMAWVISLVWTSRTCWPRLTWAVGSLGRDGAVCGLGGVQFGLRVA